METTKWAKWDLPEGYEFYDKDGNLIDTTEITIRKKGTKYPATFDECLEIYHDEIDYMPLEGLRDLRQLIYCRDTYWRLANWKPDWDDNTTKYCISLDECASYFESIHIHQILAFPTPEMRSAFDDHFEELIKKCGMFT